MELGKAIKEVRKEKKIKKKDLAKMCGISDTALYNIERGVSFPTKNTIDRICQSLNVPESYLLLCSISKEDVPDGKWLAFQVLHNSLKNLLV